MSLIFKTTLSILGHACFSCVAKPSHCPRHRINVFTFGKSTTDSVILLRTSTSSLAGDKSICNRVILVRCSNLGLMFSHAFDSMFIFISGTFRSVMEVRRALVWKRVCTAFASGTMEGTGTFARHTPKTRHGIRRKSSRDRHSAVELRSPTLGRNPGASSASSNEIRRMRLWIVGCRNRKGVTWSKGGRDTAQ